MSSCGSYNWTQAAAESLDVQNDHLYSRPASLFAAICAILLSVVGVPGNLVTMLALTRSPALRAHATTAFIVSLCASDLVFCTLCLPPTAARFFLSRWPLGPTACALFPLFFYGNVAVSMLSMTAIAINRYILIMWHGTYARLYSCRNIVLMVITVWVAGFSMLVPPLLGVWGCLGLDTRSFSCTILKKNGSSPKKLLFLVGFALPSSVMAAAYLCIYWRVRRSRAALRAHAGHGRECVQLPSLPINKPPASAAPGKGSHGFRRRDDRRLTRLMLTVFCSFLVCFLPLTIANAYDKLGVPPILELLSSVLAWASAVINPFIYAATNRQYRAAYRRVLCGAPEKASRARLTQGAGPPSRRRTSESASLTATTIGRIAP